MLLLFQFSAENIVAPTRHRSSSCYSLIQTKCQGGNKYALPITVKFDQSTRRFGRISFARLLKLIKHVALLFYLLSPYLLLCMRGLRNVSWLVGCFGFNGPLRQYFSLYRAVSQKRGRKRREWIDESKNVQTTPTRTYCKCSRPLPYCNPNCRTPQHWKFTQHHRTTRPPQKKCQKYIYY